MTDAGNIIAVTKRAAFGNLDAMRALSRDKIGAAASGGSLGDAVNGLTFAWLAFLRSREADDAAWLLQAFGAVETLLAMVRQYDDAALRENLENDLSGMLAEIEGESLALASFLADREPGFEEMNLTNAAEKASPEGIAIAKDVHGWLVEAGA